MQIDQTAKVIGAQTSAGPSPSSLEAAAALGLQRLNIELTAVCSYECVGCPNTYMERKKGHMSQQLFTSIIDETAPFLKKMFLWNYGEPLLNPKAPRMVEHTRGSGVQTILSTTGYVIPRLADVSFLSALGELIVSINGLTPDVYAFHQKGGDLNTVLEGLRRIRPVMEAADTTYTLQAVANKRNVAQLDQLNSFAKEHGFKRVVVKSFNVLDNDPKTFEEFVPVGTEFARYTAFGKTFAPAPTRKEPCLSWMVINWNGDVNPCCWDYTGEHILGNVERQGVLGVWNSPEAQVHRAAMLEKKYLKICTDCQNGKTVKEWKVE